MTGRPCVIVDVDGTLVDVSAIRHYVLNPGRRRDFAKFHGASALMPAIPEVVAIAQALDRAGIPIVILTSRKEQWRYTTRRFLRKWGVPAYAVGMRAEHDDRPDDVVKADLLAQVRAMGLEPVLAIDDNPLVIALWRSLGIPTVRVPGWDMSTRVKAPAKPPAKPTT